MGLYTNKKYFVFDLDNTLVKTNLANNKSYAEAIEIILGERIEFDRGRFTRANLTERFPWLSKQQASKIVEKKEESFAKYLPETILNQQLFKILMLIKERGRETILLTESRERRAKEVCIMVQCHIQA